MLSLCRPVRKAGRHFFYPASLRCSADANSLAPLLARAHQIPCPPAGNEWQPVKKSQEKPDF
jgi:hypothetical protein